MFGDLESNVFYLIIVSFFVFVCSMGYTIANQEKKCIDGRVHKLVPNAVYWQGTGFSCKPLTVKETLDAKD